MLAWVGARTQKWWVQLESLVFFVLGPYPEVLRFDSWFCAMQGSLLVMLRGPCAVPG